jgi:hypothetical protein
MRRMVPARSPGGPAPYRPDEGLTVHVRESFKGEILGLQAELQVERQKASGNARKVTEGEIIELMLEAYKTARRNGEAGGKAVPLAKVS